MQIIRFFDNADTAAAAIESALLLDAYRMMVTIDGGWQDKDGNPIFTNGHQEIDWIWNGSARDSMRNKRGYLTARVDGEWIRVKPQADRRAPTRIRVAFEID